MILKKIYGFLLIITLLTVVLPLCSFAQSASEANYLEMSMLPENPEPLQSVTLTVKSLTYDLDRSKITWFVDGQKKVTEMGLKQYSTQAGKNGQKMTIKVQVETPNDGVKIIEAFFIPALVDLIPESRSYVPPFYKGKALNPSLGLVSVAAIPEFYKTTGEKIPAQNIVYTWKKDGKAQPAFSGLGKNYLSFTGTVPVRDTVVEVSASSLDGNIYASKKITITNVSPKIIFYENNPLYGIMMNKAISGTIKMLTDEFSVLAVPYFFSAGLATSPDLKYIWGMNDQSLGSQEIENVFTARNDKEISGSADISLKISNSARVFQSANNMYSIDFTK